MPRYNSIDGIVWVGGSGNVVLDLGVNGNRIDFDADNDTSIRASGDDVVVIEVAGADDFTIRANALDIETGSKIAHKAAVASYLSFLIDVNGNEILDTQAVASAVNQIGISNAATGNGPIIATRGETNVDLNITPNGTGDVVLTSGHVTMGDGGTVTQATNKSTGVTLNTESGQITMNGAALGAGAEVTFTVTNDKVAATDVVIVNHGSAGTSGSYLVGVSAVAAGSFDVTVSNVSAGSLSEAIVINFAVIGGASS